MLYFIKWPNAIVWLPLLLEILFSMRIAIISFPIYDVINFEINLDSLIKLFSYMTNKGRTKNLGLSEIVTLRHYATFKLKKIESLFYKINTFLQKSTTCIGFQAEQILCVSDF